MFLPGDVISHSEMCTEESRMLQAGMHYLCGGDYSVVLMSKRPGAPYEDEVQEDGRVLIYEGHDWAKSKQHLNPKTVDQPVRNSSGTLTQNGKFFEAARRHASDKREPELVRVYEKLYAGIWVYNGVFELVDAWLAESNGRKVFKFRLELTDQGVDAQQSRVNPIIEHARLIPTSVKREVFKRDGGKCVQCGASDNLHFDHILPYSKGGTSLKAENIQLLCARHNIEKRDKIL